jgi:transcriptional regulator with XRE-family HTH domain
MKTDPLQKRLGQAIRRRREALGYSQDSMADAIEMHRAYYSAVERGEKNLTLKSVERLARAVEARISELMAEAGD